jgi:capsular polysaccharide export protein
MYIEQESVLSRTPKEASSESICQPLLLDHLPNYKKVLLLQGPVGGFFQKLSDYWTARGAEVIKVNFNPGDDHFYTNEAIQYKESLFQWPRHLRGLLITREIDAVFLFGDCRPIHKPAKSLCDTLNTDLWCFEEGYFRPNFYTLEKNGVNYYSSLTHTNPDSLPSQELKTILTSYPKRFTQMCLLGFQYWLANVMHPNRYPYYTHHRDLNFQKAVFWIRSFLRYLKYKITERSIRKLITSSASNASSDYDSASNSNPNSDSNSRAFFLVPLQVHDDSQMTEHSDYQSVEEYIEEVLTSFAEHVKGTSSLDSVIIKHHPMDRGHVHYGSFISSLSESLGISSQVIYVHDLALPEIFPHCKGCITVNSTFGLQSLSYQVPVMTMGRCFYAKEGLTFQGTLQEFWKNPGKVNQDIFNNYKVHVIATTQVNGCLYSKEYEIK